MKKTFEISLMQFEFLESLLSEFPEYIRSSIEECENAMKEFEELEEMFSYKNYQKYRDEVWYAEKD